jgi:hypothetical protein
MGFFKKITDRVTKPKSSVSLKLDKNAFTWGDKLEGTLTVNSEEEVDATEIRAELRCEEKKKEIVHTTETITSKGCRAPAEGTVRMVLTLSLDTFCTP